MARVAFCVAAIGAIGYTAITFCDAGIFTAWTVFAGGFGVGDVDDAASASPVATAASVAFTSAPRVVFSGGIVTPSWLNACAAYLPHGTAGAHRATTSSLARSASDFTFFGLPGFTTIVSSFDAKSIGVGRDLAAGHELLHVGAVGRREHVGGRAALDLLRQRRRRAEVERDRGALVAASGSRCPSW